MKKFLLILCWAFSMYAGVECRRQPFMAGPIDRIKAALRLNRRVGHIVVEIRPTASTFRYYEFSLSRIRKRLRLLDTKVGTINFNVKNGGRFNLEAANAVNEFKKVVKVKASKVSVSAVVAEEHKEIGNPHELCKSALEAFGSLGYYVKSHKCLTLNANSKILLLWFLLNGGFQKFKDEKYYPIIHLSSDLAGIAFPTTSATNLTDVDPKEIFNLPFYGSNIYASGNELMGVDRATSTIFQVENWGPSPTNYQSTCLFPGLRYQTEIRGRNLTITGKIDKSRTAKVDMKKCIEVVEEVVEGFKKPPQFPGQKILSVSNYYKRSVVSRREKSWRGGEDRMVSTGNSYIAQARYKFNTFSVFSKDVFYNCEARCYNGDYNKHPKQCLDSIYAYTLLRDYFSVQYEDEILNYKSLYSQEVHWTLSVAFLNICQRYRLKFDGSNLLDDDSDDYNK